MVMYDEKAFEWMENEEWFIEHSEEDGGDYELTDKAPESARKSFERFQLFRHVTCADFENPSPAYTAYLDYVREVDGAEEDDEEDFDTSHE